MPLVMLGVFACAIGILQMAELAVGLWARWRQAEPSPVAIARLGVLLMLPLFALSMVKTLQPLHGNRVGNREAGRWLAQHVHAGDVIDDEHRWSEFYSGLFFRDVDESKLPPDPDAKRYTVVTRWIAHGGGGEVAETRNEIEKRAGKLVYQWPANAPVDKARVVVYATSRDPATVREGSIDGQPVSLPR